MTVTVEAAARSHIGLVRRRNEDAFHLGSRLFAVADGLGGHAAGDVASATVIDSLSTCDRPIPPAALANLFGEAIHRANETLRRRVEADPALAGMGTTLVAMLWSDSSAVFANVGDSRAYLLRSLGEGATSLVQLTEDHTYGNLVADAEDVPHLPERISRFLDGRVDGRSPDLTRRQLRPGDRFLLCSDGLSAVVPHEVIREELSSSNDREEIVGRLIAHAIERGGPDNITVIVVDVQDCPDE